jgi:hypothetical protein
MRALLALVDTLDELARVRRICARKKVEILHASCSTTPSSRAAV